MYESKSLASVTPGLVVTDDIASGLFVESQVDPCDEPSKLDEEVGRLEADDTHDVGERDVEHRKTLESEHWTSVGCLRQSSRL